LVLKLLPSALRKRRLIMSRRKARGRYMAGWFKWKSGRSFLEEDHGT
jgi:hypothetical protein